MDMESMVHPAISSFFAGGDASSNSWCAQDDDFQLTQLETYLQYPWELVDAPPQANEDIRMAEYNAKTPREYFQQPEGCVIASELDSAAVAAIDAAVTSIGGGSYEPEIEGDKDVEERDGRVQGANQNYTKSIQVFREREDVSLEEDDNLFDDIDTVAFFREQFTELFNTVREGESPVNRLCNIFKFPPMFSISNEVFSHYLSVPEMFLLSSNNFTLVRMKPSVLNARTADNYTPEQIHSTHTGHITLDNNLKFAVLEDSNFAVKPNTLVILTAVVDMRFAIEFPFLQSRVSLTLKKKESIVLYFEKIEEIKVYIDAHFGNSRKYLVTECNVSGNFVLSNHMIYAMEETDFFVMESPFKIRFSESDMMCIPLCNLFDDNDSISYANYIASLIRAATIKRDGKYVYEVCYARVLDRDFSMYMASIPREIQKKLKSDEIAMLFLRKESHVQDTCL